MGTRKGRGSHVRANAARLGASDVASTTLTDIDRNGLIGLNADQWQRLVELLNKSDASEKMTSISQWIINSGASNHMTGNLKALHDVHDIVACPVGLPNGEQTNAIKEGTTFLEGGLKLTRVLYVPKLSCSLLSVSQLLDESNFLLQFTNKLCVMQDRTSRMLIGAGKRRDGLYYFRGERVVKACKTSGENQLSLWHKRLGHPSYKITQSIPKLLVEPISTVTFIISILRTRSH
ncbi:hypothetical protein L6164_008667 [Bauhinia variegata]|uniref:Uncharacterized protein n=1 Tax=Bauhinia variegata TaxID=167791 RepID=A0ACB9PHG0_BAUVA|nr:hypothetical protein L6164_008667 [Bauhinia variegata]